MSLTSLACLSINNPPLRSGATSAVSVIARATHSSSSSSSSSLSHLDTGLHLPFTSTVHLDVCDQPTSDRSARIDGVQLPTIIITITIPIIIPSSHSTSSIFSYCHATAQAQAHSPPPIHAIVRTWASSPRDPQPPGKAKSKFCFSRIASWQQVEVALTYWKRAGELPHAIPPSPCRVKPAPGGRHATDRAPIESF